ncbi:signal transduction histidine kinase [Candidatus Scalindua japonica]|uniref:histidine kinase n=1 Tax=Candidatus Scalindua japonica TaxID=1284222 RepID=A0A286U1X2_9BACT|nr:ATP-binding protein [Candidatus Scalindua japonica]GAX62150.1 signal transduction histidine kinase [Candidatus Scalindua japonica]
MLKFTGKFQGDTEFISYDIGELIEQSIDFTMPRWKNMAQSRGIDYSMDRNGMLKTPSILCNPTELREVFINKINNAMDAMPDGGQLSFSTWCEPETVFITISDTGTGMPEEVKKRVFEPFFTTKSAAGTGLGMSTAYGIMARHGGIIDVESELGKGCTFTLELPIAEKTVNPTKPPISEQKVKGNDLSVLVVDDDEDICSILDNFLSKAGYKVLTVNNGANAIKQTEKEGFDLVLCDMAMPEIFGYDVIRALNTLNKRPKIGIIGNKN